jgi:hypothetical protein
MTSKKITIDDLAIMVQKGFVDLEGGLSKKIANLSIDLGKLKADVDILKEGQERIELRLANVAYRFEIVDLQSRVQALEEKLGIKNQK